MVYKPPQAYTTSYAQFPALWELYTPPVPAPAWRGGAPRKTPFQLDKWGFTPHLAKFEWVFKGARGRAGVGV